MLCATPQLSARPRPRSGCVESMGDRLRRIPARTRTRSGACMLDTYMRTAPTLILLDGGPSQATWAALWLAEATKARPRPTRDSVTRHPCRQAAFFLPCASRPPDVCRFVSPDPASTTVPATVALSSPLAPVSTPWPAVARTPRTESRRPTTLMALQPSAVPPPVAQGRVDSPNSGTSAWTEIFLSVPRPRCIYRAQAPRSWPQDVPQFQE
jgi:hypothetical protein